MTKTTSDDLKGPLEGEVSGIGGIRVVLVNLAEWAKSPFSGLAHDLNASQLIEALKQLGYFIDRPVGWGRGGYCTKNASAFSACGDCLSARELREGVPDQRAVGVKLPPCVTVPRNRHRDLVAFDDFSIRNFRAEWRYDSNPVADAEAS